MALPDQIQADLTAAMKARDKAATAALRGVVAAIRNARVAEGQTGELSDEQTMELLTREAKKRTEAAEAFADAGRDEQAAAERAELEVIRRYLPTELDEGELQAIVDQTVEETGASGPEDFGRVMGAVMPRVKGRADGKRVNALVRERLQAG
ncbi:MAG TPA: GatB/YqeY domain-containing protein [Egibacteraceae bacterium]|nr:GatB/YqeY domain-containing protein [Egibacteraceae bacterium]